MLLPLLTAVRGVVLTGKLVVVDLEWPAIVFVAMYRSAPTIVRARQQQCAPIEHANGVLRVLCRGEEHSTEASAASVGTGGDVGAQNVARSAEEVFEILPLTVEGQLCTVVTEV